MTEKQLREKIAKLAASYVGANQGGARHKKIIDLFNKVQPDGWAMNYTAAWCATFVSALAIEAFGVTKAKQYFPLSANCGTIVTKAKKMGIWQERDSYRPDIGDWIIYNWSDSGYGDNVGNEDHVGIVESVTSARFVVVEGNYSNSVKRRTVTLDSRYIRGFVTPNYAKMAGKTSAQTKPTKKTVTELAKEVIDGKWGNGEERKKKLTAAGYDYDAVQKKVDELLKPKTSAIKVGDTVKVVNAINYDNGKRFAIWNNAYKVMELKGDRAVIGVNGVVTSAINVKNLKKV